MGNESNISKSLSQDLKGSLSGVEVNFEDSASLTHFMK